MKMLFAYNFGKLSLAVIPDSQKKAEKSDWTEIDPETLPDDCQDLLVEYKDAYHDAHNTPQYQAMKTAKAAFEAAMRSTGGCSTGKAKAKSSKAVSLASFLTSNANGGYAS